MAKILVVDDDALIREILETGLSNEGFQVACAANGQNGLALAQRENPDLVILDLMMPGMPGHEVCRALRAFSSAPVMMLTAKGADKDKVIGLAVGADEYLTKPFSLIELVARVKALLRRVERAKADAQAFPKRLVIGPLVIDSEQRLVHLEGQPLNLRHKEFELLCLLASNLNKTFSRDTILYRIWGDDFYGDSRVVDVHICRLRDKLRKFPACPVEIRSIRSLGYRCTLIDQGTTSTAEGPAVPLGLQLHQHVLVPFTGQEHAGGWVPALAGQLQGAAEAGHLPFYLGPVLPPGMREVKGERQVGVPQVHRLPREGIELPRQIRHWQQHIQAVMVQPAGIWLAIDVLWLLDGRLEAIEEFELEIRRWYNANRLPTRLYCLYDLSQLGADLFWSRLVPQYPIVLGPANLIVNPFCTIAHDNSKSGQLSAAGNNG